jgi:proteasome assembly chaperone (PAC2) family protein
VRPFAEIDLENFVDFTSARPVVRLDDDGHRVVDWPRHQLAAAAVPWAATDVVTLVGPEPHLRWRAYLKEITELAKALEVSMVVTLGALLAEVPHSRQVSVVGTTDDATLRRRLDLRPSRYEGPTGIVGALGAACHDAGIPYASLWAAVPTYVSAAPSPKAALALVEKVAAMLNGPTRTTELEIASAAYERQIDELIAGDEDTAAYVAGLLESADEDDDDIEVTDDDEPTLEDANPAAFVEEVERYLRDHPDR